MTKRFPGVLALDEVGLTVHPGQVHALVGENGAGKSTLMKILSGIYRPDAGQIWLRGEPVRIASPQQAQRLGISTIHQELGLMPDLTVEQNVFFGREPYAGTRFNLAPRAMRRRTEELLDRVGLALRPGDRVGDLTIATQQMVEIAKALAFDARVLIMDEPTAALTERETEALFRVMADFISPHTAIIYISHRMDEVKRVADAVTVLRDGRWIATTPADQISVAEVIEQMVGRSLETDARPEPHDASAPVRLKVEGLATEDLLREVSLEVRCGEILGLAGLVGAGRTETARAIIGADPRSAGRIEVGGQPVEISSPADAVRHSIAYLSEDRKRYGLLLDKSLVENIALPSYGRWSRVSVVNDDAAVQTAERFIEQLRIKTPSPWQEVQYLSGGNQQKVVLAKWLARDCDVLIIDEPTRGIDVGAKEEIYRLLEDLAACSGSRAGEGGEGAGQSIAVVAKGYASPFWATVKAGAEAAGKDLGYQVSFNGPDSETDVPRQNDQLQQALVKHPRRSSSPRWTPRPRPPSCSSSLRPPSR